jgi:glucokinase
MNGTALGIEIGGTKLQVLAADSADRIIHRVKLPVEATKGAAGIRAQLEATLPSLVSRHQPDRIGVGFGGPVDWRTGHIARSHQVEGWSGFELTAWLSQLTGVQTWADNDANVAALGEARRGAGAGANPAFYVTLGSGVGGGLVVDGRIYHGVTPGESEIGHLRLDRAGTILETRCSGWAVDRKVRAFADANPGSLLASLAGSQTHGVARHLATALVQGDVAARSILEETAADLAFGLSHVVHLFHPEVIVIGGGLSHLGEPLKTAIEQALPPGLMAVFQPGPRILLASLGEDAVPVGAIEMSALR